MEIKYSKTPFEGHTHRFIVEFNIGDRDTTSLHIYSNSGDYQLLDGLIKLRKAQKVLSFEIVHRATKEQDQAASEFIDSIFSKEEDKS